VRGCEHKSDREGEASEGPGKADTEGLPSAHFQWVIKQGAYYAYNRQYHNGKMNMRTNKQGSGGCEAVLHYKHHGHGSLVAISLYISIKLLENITAS
jgi:hypothetical protein